MKNPIAHGAAHICGNVKRRLWRACRKKGGRLTLKKSKSSEAKNQQANSKKWRETRGKQVQDQQTNKGDTGEDMKIAEFKVSGDPQGKGRARHTVRGGIVRTYTPTKTEKYENVIKQFAKIEMIGKAVFSGPVVLQLTARFPIPKSWTKTKKAQAAAGEIYPTVKPDFDNIGKVIADAMNKIVYLDDSQIVCSIINKVYSKEPGIDVLVLKKF